MFSTFTGNSRRPRNVNLSGQTGNPFANTSWSPAVVSNATKTVSDAQADRERRHAERQRLKAAGKIQKTWRGYSARRDLAELRRATFDALYRSDSPSESESYSTKARRLPLAFTLLLSFFTARRTDDLYRIIDFAQDAEVVDSSQLTSNDVNPSKIRHLVDILVAALQTVIINRTSLEAYLIINLILRVASDAPHTIVCLTKGYFAGLSALCQHPQDTTEDLELLLGAITRPLELGSQHGCDLDLHEALAFQLLASGDLPLLQDDMSALAKAIDIRRLSRAISKGYENVAALRIPKEDSLWLLAHFIDLGRHSMDSSNKFEYLKSLYDQLARFSSEISLRISLKDVPNGPETESDNIMVRSLDPYVSQQLQSLVDSEGISGILRDFSASLAASHDAQLSGTSLLAGLISSLMLCFPAQADETRMKLFLEQIPTPRGQMPLVQLLWHTMRQTSIFEKLVTESERTTDILRKYVHGKSAVDVEEQEWRIILLFLELYIFVLRLSDDEDFLSAISPERFTTQTSSSSRLRACSLSLDHIKALTTALKNTAFSLYYNSQEISQNRQLTEVSGKAINGPATSATVMRLDLDSLRTIITTAMKMLYERDSRLHFLPADFWLMVNKFDQESFVKAVIEEEQVQRRAEDEDDSDTDDAMDESAYYSGAARDRLSRNIRIERLRVSQLRAQKDRRLAEMGPKLEILKHMPFAVPFETRVMIFRKFVMMDREEREVISPFFMGPMSRHHAQIRRGILFEDAYKAFFDIGDGLKDPISITFVDKFDTPEAGIDGGGVTKEFLTSVISEAFGAGDVDLGMFTSSSTGLLYPEPTAIDCLREDLKAKGHTEGSPEWRDAMSGMLKRFEFLGRIFGKCMYEGILVDVAFAGFFLLKWPSPSRKEENSYKGSVNDLRDMDEELYRGLLRLKNHPGDIAELGIDFTISDRISRSDAPSKTVTRNLIANGDQVYVTNDNRLLYNSYVARHRLVLQPAMQTQAFLRGLRAIIKPTWLSMFNQSELQRLVGGDSSEIDIEDLRLNTVYSGLYEIGDDGEEHPTIKLFWKVMAGFTDAQRRDVVKYVSSTPRAPLLGFSQLFPKFSIRDGGTDEDRLPSTSTCVNLLKLPRYTRESTLRDKLLYAVTSGAGFDLS